jgi:hypothetical protein
MRARFPRTLSLCLQLALVSACADRALAAERSPVTSIKPLLVAAIDHGEAHGELVGEAAHFMRERFKSSAPIVIDVTTLAPLPEPGCKRLEVTTRQEGIIEAATQQPARKELIYQVSYCRDGRFPHTK